MKKIVTLAIVLALTLSLVACSSSDDKNSSDTSIISSIVETQTSSTNETNSNVESTVSPESSIPQNNTTTTKPQNNKPSTTSKTCSHNFSTATCKSPQTCKLCGLTTGSIGEHQFKDEVCVYCNELSPMANEVNAGNDAYWSLKTAHELCVELMNSIYGAWYFAIYKADDYLNTQSCLEHFCSQTNLDYNEALTALNDVLDNMGISNPTGTEQLAALRTFSIAVDIAVQTYINNGTYDVIDTNLSKAKTSLKSLTNTYDNDTGYSTLKSYYSEVAAYAEFCESPTGSFGQLKTTIDTYETNLRNYKMI